MAKRGGSRNRSQHSDMQWDQFYKEQMKTLNLLNASFSSSLDNSEEIKSSLENINDSISNTLTNAVHDLSNIIDDSEEKIKELKADTESSIREMYKSMRDTSNFSTSVSNKIDDIIENARNTFNDTSKSAADMRLSVDDYISQARDLIESEQSKRNLQSDTNNFIEDIRERLSDESIKLSSDALKTINSIIEDINETIADTDMSAEDMNAAVQEYRKNIQRVIRDDQTRSQNHDKFLETLKHKVGTLFELAAKKINDVSKITNSFIAGTGNTYEDSREFRADMRAIVNNLNSDTGQYYNQIEAYQEMMTIASQSGIGDVDALRELTRPILLASDTTNMNLTSLTSLLGKWSTRYNFSSREMESMVDEIRGNTAGNNATSDSIQNAINTLADTAAIANNGDPQKLEEYMKSVSNAVAYLGDSGLSDTAISTITDMVNSIADNSYRSNSELMALLGNLGIDPEIAHQWATSTDKVDDTFLILAQSIDKLFDTTGDVAPLVSSLFGVDYATMKNIAAATVGKGNENTFTKEDYEEFLREIAKAPSAADTVDSMYVSATDKINNWLSSIYSVLSSVQEAIGIGFSDILAIYGVYKAGKGLLNLASRAGLAGGTGGASLLGTAAANGGAALGLSGAAGTLAGGAAGLAGVGVGAYGLYDAYKEAKSGDYGSAAISGTAGVAALGGTVAALAGAGPAGWAVALGGAVVLGIKKVADHLFPDVGTDGLIEERYRQVAQSVLEKSKNTEDQLVKIKRSLKDTGDINTAYNDLVNTGLLSEKDKQLALKAVQEDNIEALQELTEAYLSAEQEFGRDYSNYMTETGRENQKIANETFLDIEELLQDWNDDGPTADELSAANDIMYRLYQVLDSQDPDSLNDYAKAELAEMREVFKDGVMDATEFNDIMDKGWRNQYFEGMNIDAEGFMEALGNTIYLNETNEELFARFQDAVDDFVTAQDASNQYIKEHRNTENSAEESHDTGTNYITKDHIAKVHEGEAIIPRQFNPLTHYGTVADILESRKSGDSEYMKEFVSTLKEIHSFLVEWKKDNNYQETIRAHKNRYATSSDMVAQYLSY